MQIPSKIRHGEKVVSTVFDKINGIIDYLHASKVKAGTGIMVQESPSGTVVYAEVKPDAAQEADPPSGLAVRISSGTATVSISGSTALTIEPGANIQLSGGTNGELIISATGGTAGTTGFPDYSNLVESSVDITGTTTYSYQYPVWVTGYVGAIPDQNNQMHGELNMWVGTSPNQRNITILNIGIDFVDCTPWSVGNYVCVPIPANVPFYFITHYSELLVSNDLKIFGCI